MNEILINKTKQFLKDIDKIPKELDINKKINKFISEFSNKILGVKSNALCIYNGIIFRDIEYQIYSYRITNNYRIIFSYDKDELFEQTIIVFYGIVSNEDLGKRIQKIINAIKDDFGVSNGEK